MTDVHIHLEGGEYTLGWLEKFVSRAKETDTDEIWLLEHSYLFREFAPMYGCILGKNAFTDGWFSRRGGIRELSEYLALIGEARRRSFPVRVRFGLEVCYFEGAEEFVRDVTRGLGLDFLVGSVHFIDGFAFDHEAALWDGVDIDRAYRRYFESSVRLAESGVFDGIAHPDSIGLFGFQPSFPLDEYYDALAAAVSNSGMYAEENAGTYRRHPDTSPFGMNASLIRAMKRHGVRIVTASDAHTPYDVGAGIREAQRAVDSVTV